MIHVLVVWVVTLYITPQYHKDHGYYSDFNL